MAPDALQRPRWDGEPAELGQLFHVRQERGDKQLEAVCRLLSHELGWELRLEVNGDLQRSGVCRTREEVLSTVDEWNASMLEKGWK
jgi:hypothetical protein